MKNCIIDGGNIFKIDLPKLHVFFFRCGGNTNKECTKGTLFWFVELVPVVTCFLEPLGVKVVI